MEKTEKTRFVSIDSRTRRLYSLTWSPDDLERVRRLAKVNPHLLTVQEKNMLKTLEKHDS